jgi:LemA protein
MKNIIWVILGVVAIFAIWVFSSYNGLVSANEAVASQWAQVESQYQRRFDLIPNLVASVKGIMTQEQEVFASIADARTKYSGATTPDAKAQAATQVESALGRLLVITENYPELKSSANVQDLMTSLEGTENRISVERKRYNDLVRDYNLKTKQIPSSIAAAVFGFKEHVYFEAAEGTETAPAVDLQ